VGRRRGLVGFRRPPEAAQIHRATRRELDAFSQQQRPLEHRAVLAREGDAARRVDHPPPRQIAFLGKRGECPPDRACRTGAAGEPGHDAVSRDPSFGDVADDAVDPVIEGIHTTSDAHRVGAPGLILTVDGTMSHRVEDAR